jgi:hypothetical protein
MEVVTILFYTDPYQEFSKILDPRRIAKIIHGSKTALNKVFPIHNTVPYQVSVTQKYLPGMILCEV